MFDIKNFKKEINNIIEKSNNIIEKEEKLNLQIKELEKEDKIINNNTEIINNEVGRTIEIINNSDIILDNIERDFKQKTGLKTKKDISFLFAGIALQCIRIYFINKLTKIQPAGKGNTTEDILHKTQEEILNKINDGKDRLTGNYYAPLNQIATTTGVPYDATRYDGESGGFFKGANHRFATLGHDPLLGLIFGTANIMTNTITLTPFEKLKVPFTHHVNYSFNYKNPKIGRNASTIKMLAKCGERVIKEKDIKSLVAAIIKQIIHIGTDLFTPCGIQLPGLNILLDNKTAEMITKYISAGDVIKATGSGIIASLINKIIETIYLLMYCEEKDSDLRLYSVKAKKIILISNSIATGSNVILTVVNTMFADKTAIKDLDFGGLYVLIKRLFTDKKFIEDIKREYINEEFEKILDKDLELEEINWN